MKTSILYLTEGGARLASRISSALNDSCIFDCRGKLQETVSRQWSRSDAIIFIMAAGIVVRTIAPYLKDKYEDPAVVVCDEQARFAISLLSGHAGGANSLARQVAEIIKGTPVITTASDVLGRTALDLWAREHGLVPADRKALTRAMGKLVNNGKLRVWSSLPLPALPEDMEKLNSPEKADVIITCGSLHDAPSQTASETGMDPCILYAPVLSAGIGCNRGTASEQISRAVSEAFSANGLSLQSLSRIGTIDLKKDEDGLVQFARSLNIPLLFFTKEQLNSVKGCGFSKAAMKATGARGVAEPAALLAASSGMKPAHARTSPGETQGAWLTQGTCGDCQAELIVRKMKWKDVTVAVAKDTCQWWEQARAPQTL